MEADCYMDSKNDRNLVEKNLVYKIWTKLTELSSQNLNKTDSNLVHKVWTKTDRNLVDKNWQFLLF